jgi:hypothetical protein
MMTEPTAEEPSADKPAGDKPAGQSQAQQPDEMQQLRDQVTTLQSQLDAQPATTPTQVIVQPARQPGAFARGGRTVASFVLILIAAVLAPLAVVSTFAVGEISDTERYVNTVAPLAEDPTIQAAVTDRLTNEIFSYIDLDEISDTAVKAIGETADLSTDQEAILTALTGPLKSGLQSFTQDQIAKIVQSDAFANAWAEANRVAHEQIVKLLSGDASGTLKVEDGEISVDIGSVVDEVKTALVDNGFTLAENIPEVTAVYVLYQSDSLATLQTYYSIANTLGYWLPIVAIILALAGIFAANHRRTAVIGLGFGVLASMVVLSLALSVVRSEYLLALPPEANRDAAGVAYDQITLFLYEGLRAAALAGLILGLAAILSGPSRTAAKIRGVAQSAAAKAGDGLERINVPMAKIQPVAARYTTAARIVSVVIAIAVVLLPDYTTPSLVIWTTIVLLVVLFIIEVLSVPRPAATSSDVAAPADSEDDSDPGRGPADSSQEAEASTSA